MIYDLAIIGGGPAGVAAGVYAARKKLKTVFITKDFSGQSSVSEDVQNWIGTISISGTDLSKSLEAHLRAYASDVVDIKTNQYAKKIEKTDQVFSITTDKEVFQTKTVLVTVGSVRRKLTTPGADIFENKGLTYCASCDGPLFADQDVVVVGGGNAAFETCAQLLAYCKSVTLFNRSGEFRADPITVEKTLANPKMKAIKNAQLTLISGDQFVKSVNYKVDGSDETIEFPTTGIFVEIGLIPNTNSVIDLVDHDTYGHIKVDPRNQRTSVEGVWSAGDCTDGIYHQNNIAAGDAVKALEDIYMHLHLHS